MGRCHDNAALPLRMCESRTSMTTDSSMDEHPPQSVLSLSTEASSQIMDPHDSDPRLIIVDDDEEEFRTTKTTTATTVTPSATATTAREKREENPIDSDDDDEDDDTDAELDGKHGCCPRSSRMNDEPTTSSSNNNSHHNTTEDEQQQQGQGKKQPRTLMGAYFQQMEDVPRVYIEKLYENTVDGPCQTVSFCEVDQLDLFVNCQQPLSFLGFGHQQHQKHSSGDGIDLTSSSGSYRNDYDYDDDHDDRPLLPGAYAVPKGCEYCGSPSTSQCRRETCRRPPLFFQKKRPPFAVQDASMWDPVNDDAIIPPPLVAAAEVHVASGTRHDVQLQPPIHNSPTPTSNAFRSLDRPINTTRGKDSTSANSRRHDWV